MSTRVVLFTKSDANCAAAIEVAKGFFGADLTVHSGPDTPKKALEEPAEIILSYRSPWIIPARLLAASDLALNWHPGDTHYPGIGCYNFALYEDAQSYGCVCHHMAAAVDTGRVIEERRFPVLAGESVQSLMKRTLTVMLGSFREMVQRIHEGGELPVSERQWDRPPFTRRQLNDLLVLQPDMTREEILRRVRATEFPGFPMPALRWKGLEFEYRHADLNFVEPTT